MILSISRLLLDTIYREEHYLKTLLQQLHFRANGKSMTNEVRTKSPYVHGLGADALYQTNMVECHRAFQISR
jgi:hypothetical protein